ncbi:unnamed protein product [Allacma fusca]|uniref:Uncharacterized protein n=1 Tax=Allacma fusca TaxID=39272 RepID=A0A8J2JNC6_9HEXA|nr:unnamed protein product [Allacma fusca]
MKVFILTAALVICETIAQGDRCLFNIPVNSSTIVCGPFEYHRDQRAMDAVNFCGKEKNGTEITNRDVNCIFERLGYIVNGALRRDNMLAAYIKTFPFHFGDLCAETCTCVTVTQEVAQGNGTSQVECLSGAFSRICGHKTCDSINTLD